MQTRIQIAKSDIISFFDSLTQKVFNEAELSEILSQHRSNWRLAQKTTTYEFIEFLSKKSNLRKIALRPEKKNSETILRYSWGHSSKYQVAISIAKGAFLSHGTALYLHALNDQIPARIYVNHEQSKKPKREVLISQESIDSAFSAPQRVSECAYHFEQTMILKTNGKFTNRLGVGFLKGDDGEAIEATLLERTLIDACVRPYYSGGPIQVLEAFRRAKDKLSTNILVSTLNNLDYIYPYIQAIGFYMERAGYEESRLSLLRKADFKYNFYLTYEMRQVDYSKKWKLFHPKGF